MMLRYIAIAFITVTVAQAQTTQESQEFSTLFYTTEYQEALAFYQQHHNQISIDPALITHGKELLNALEEKITSLPSAYYAKKGVSFLGTMGKYLGTSIGIPAGLVLTLSTWFYLHAKKELKNNPQDMGAQSDTENNFDTASISGRIAIVSYGIAAAAKATEYVAQNSVAPYEKKCAKAAALKKLLAFIETPATPVES